MATQKLMTKSAWKGTLKDDASLAALTIPEGTEVRKKAIEFRRWLLRL